MCVLGITEAFEAELFHVWDPAERVSKQVLFAAGETIDCAIYDTDGSAACLQFGDGSIVIGLPMGVFEVRDRCGDYCMDPNRPDPAAFGPLGPVPRYSQARLEAEITQLRHDAAEWAWRIGRDGVQLQLALEWDLFARPE